jgi:parallel beta-helix repeat protein
VRALIIAVTTALGVCRAADGATLVVNVEGHGVPDDCTDPAPTFTSISLAIVAAAQGDVVQVCPGTYGEHISYGGKAITIVSTDGPEVTIIDGQRQDSVVTFASGEGPGSVLMGFTIQNGRSGFDTPGFGDGGGVRIAGASPMITGNVIKNNQACDGVGISISFGSPLVQGNFITGNTRAGCSGGIGGGGIKVGGASAAQILDNVISLNVITSGSGGGISLFAAGTPTIRNNIISGNSASGISPCSEGGGIWIVNQSDAEIVQNLIVGNQATCGAGIYWLVPSGARGPYLLNNTIANNDGASGSAILADGFQARTLLVNNLVIATPGQTALLCGLFTPSAPMIRTSDVFSAGGLAYDGSCADQTGQDGNISADPVFVDQSAADYHLQADSPAIDVGDKGATGLPETDLDGNPRVIDGGSGQAIVDMGSFEFAPTTNSARRGLPQ